MLYYPQGETAPIRLQGVYVTDKEINTITDYVRSQAKPEYEDLASIAREQGMTLQEIRSALDKNSKS